MARRALYVGTGSRSIEGVEALVRRLAKIPEAVAAEVAKGVDAGADLMVATLKPIVPVSDLEANAGELRESVRKEPGDVPLERRVVEDGRDAKGRPIAKHVEHGHKAADGTHVHPVPHFWPAYRVNRKKIRARVARAVGAAVRSTVNV